MPKNRSKRLRKKLHIGEFQEFGFLVKFTLPSTIDDTQVDKFIDQFLAEAIESNDLFFGGGIYPESSGFITFGYRDSATEEHRQLVKKWLSAQSNVSNVEIGELTDAWQL
ncbi:MAG: 50S ribosome-binding protein YggL [Methylotenera sp.]